LSKAKSGNVQDAAPERGETPLGNPLEAFRRQQDILTPADLAGVSVDIVGAGALGGAILLCLCKMGFGITNTLTVTDFDRCEAHNLPTQWFRPSDVLMDEAKVDALAEMIGWICDRPIVTARDRFRGDESRRLGPVVILAVDSLRERRLIWHNLRHREDVHLLVDARMGAEVLEIHCLDPRPSRRHGTRRTGPGSEEFYEESLARPDEAFQEPCTRRGILYTTLGAASLVGSILRAHAREEDYPRHLVFDFRNFMLLAQGVGD
jgi:hypothetical protein